MSKKFDNVKSHFQAVDLVMYAVIRETDVEEFRRLGQYTDYFARLCRAIIAQQLATKAARVIGTRFDDLFSGKRATPDKVLALSGDVLRGVGLSWSKVSYIQDLAEKVRTSEVQLKGLHVMDDDAVVAELTKVKGIGQWTAEMFLMFSLGREDVFSHGDLGLKRALKILYGLRKNPSERRANEIVRKWSPYRSYGSIALWRMVD